MTDEPRDVDSDVEEPNDSEEPSTEDVTPAETPRGKRPSEEVRELKDEVKRARFREKWGKVGKGVAYAALVAVATYGAGRPDGKEDAQKAQVSTEVAYAQNAKEIIKLKADNADLRKELKSMRTWGKSVSRQMRASFKAETAGLRQYIMGYTAALSRMAARGASAKKVNEVVSQVVKDQAAAKAQADKDKADAAAARLAAERKMLKQAAAARAKPRKPAKPPSLRSLVRKKGGYRKLLMKRQTAPADPGEL
jgi:hypothetical protein